MKNVVDVSKEVNIALHVGIHFWIPGEFVHANLKVVQKLDELNFSQGINSVLD